MLRTTISTIRKVCSIAFIPRILPCNSTVTSAVVRKAYKSTKTSGDGEKAATDKSNNVIPDYKFSSAAELKIDDHFKSKIIKAASLTDNKADQNELPTLTARLPPLTARLPLTQRERCQKIIDEAFGNSGNTPPDRVLSEQYFSHTVNLEDTRRKIHESEKAKLKLQEQAHNIDSPLLPDNRSQYSIFKMSRELNVKDDNSDDIMVTNSAPAREPDLSKNLENVKGTAEDTPLVEERNLSQAKEDFDKCVNNPENIERKALCDDDAETIEVIKDERKPDLNQKATPAHQLHVPWFLKATTAKESKSNPTTKEDVNDNQKSVEKISHSLCTDDAETIKLVKNERAHDLHQEATPNDQPHAAQVLNTTTAKEEKELLTQKLETIEETSIVEAPKPKIEGFNVTPRVLGNESSLNCNTVENNQDKSSRVDMPCALDEVSKRCLNCPLGQIDEMLINEMEKLGITCRTAHKAPSNPMADDLVQMDVLNKQPIGTIEDQETLKSPEFKQEVDKIATDSRKILDENEEAEGLKKFEAIINPTEEDAHDILYPQQIRIQLEPLACKSEEYNPADDYNSPTKFAYYYLPPTLRAAEINKEEIEDTLPDSRVPIYNQIEGPPNSHAITNKQNAEPYSVLSVEGEVLDGTAKNAQTESAAEEAEATPAEKINATIASVHPLHNAPHNIRQERLLKPEYSACVKGVKVPSYYATMNASKSVGDEIRTPAERQFDKNSISSGNLTTTHVCGHDLNTSASKYENVHKTFPKESDEVEHDDRTPTQQSTTEELDEKQTAANKLFVKVPCTNLPKCSKEHTADKITQRSSKPEEDPEKTSLPDELLKEYTLNPFYVLTCNETCPISPGPFTSASKNSDFVDTTETIYMKKNICESVRPKPKPIVKSATMSSAAIPMENQPEIPCPSMPNAIESVPKLDEHMALSALLRKVRERSRLSYSEAQSGLDVQAVGKCGSKSPRCQPTGPRSPPTEPIPRPTFGLPKLKRRAPVCRPVKKPSNKCSSCTTNDEGIIPVMPCVMDEAEICAVLSKENLNDEVIYRLQNLGKILGRLLRQANSNIHMLLARDYEPWTPIPSWKIPPKPEKKQWRPGMHGVPPCVDGCPVFPKTRASMNPEPPCNLKPLPKNISQILSRGFFKTEWTKPKFVNKPYITTRDKTAAITGLDNVEDVEEQAYIKKADELVSNLSVKFPKASCSNVQIPNCCHTDKRAPANVGPLNFERLLIPPKASLAHLFVRYYAINNQQDVFWRPKARIPNEKEMLKRLRNPATRKEAEMEVKYLFLNYGHTEYLKKNNGNPNRNDQSNVPPPKQSAMSEV